MKIFFTFTNNVEPDEMQYYAAFHLGLHWLQKYTFRGFRIQIVKGDKIASPASLRCGP